MKTTLRPLIALSLLALSGMAPAQSSPVTPLGGFEGINSGWIPADPIIAAGPNSLVTMVSGKIGIFNKQGTKLFEQGLGAGGFWATQGADQVAEPWVIFDPNSGRFIASAADFGSKKGFLYLAVSKSSNPLTSADWHKYSLDRSGLHQNPAFPGVSTYPDYAKVGVDQQAIYVTSIHFAKNQTSTAGFSHAEIFALAKAPLLTGGSLQIVHDEPVITESFSSWSVFTIHPAVVFGPAPAMYFVQALTHRPDDKIVVHAVSDILTAPARTVSLVPVTAYDAPPLTVPQLGSGIGLENIGQRLASAVVRDGSLWTAHAVKDAANESVVRWYEFDISGLPAANATLIQSGDVNPAPGLHTWLPSINVDADGNMGLCFSIGGASQYAAIGCTGRTAADPAGFTHPVQTVKSGAGSYTQGGWGEYSGLAIDPDGTTFWLCHQYPNKQKVWRTHVGAFKVIPPVPQSDPLHCGNLEGTGASSGRNAWKSTVVVTMHDGNDNPVAGASVSIQWSTGATSTLPTDANGNATFTLNSISKQVSSVALTITNATHPTLNYDADANHDSDGDSNGTSLSVLRP